MTTVQLKNLKVVPEEIIAQCAAHFKIDEENTFKTMLKSGHEIRLAGLTPIYLTTGSFKDVVVTSYEKLRKEYH